MKLVVGLQFCSLYGAAAFEYTIQNYKQKEKSLTHLDFSETSEYCYRTI